MHMLQREGSTLPQQQQQHLKRRSDVFVFGIIIALALVKATLVLLEFRPAATLLQNTTTTGPGWLPYYSMSSTRKRKPHRTILEWDALGRPTNLHLAIMGDSTSRQLFHALAYFTYTGTYETNNMTPTLLNGGYPSQEAYKDAIFNYYNGSISLDSHVPTRIGNLNAILHILYNNFYYSDNGNFHSRPNATSSSTITNNALTYINKFGKHEAHGHWDPIQIYTNITYQQQIQQENYVLQHPKHVPSDLQPYLWRGNWEHTIRTHVAQLVPKTRFLVLNAGIWDHDLMENDTLPGIRRALDDHGIIGIYKTTHYSLGEQRTEALPGDVRGCQLMHYCWNLSWTASMDREEYGDAHHFKPRVNERLATELLALLKRIDDDDDDDG